MSGSWSVRAVRTAKAALQIGQRLQLRFASSSSCEGEVAGHALNRMSKLGRPIYIRIT